MNSEARENELLAQQVRKLQNEIRLLKRLGVIASAALLVLILVFRAVDHHRLSTQVLVTKDFLLIDSDGRARAQIAVFPEGAGIEAYAPSGERRLQLVGGGENAWLNLNIPVTAGREDASVNLYRENVLLSSWRSGANGAQLEMHSRDGAAILSLQDKSASLMLSGNEKENGAPRIELNANPSQACTAMTGAASAAASSSLCLHAPGLPSLELADIEGNRAVVGIPQSAELNAEGNSAASLILKHKSGNKVKLTPQAH
jgi:hypothetical protein